MAQVILNGSAKSRLLPHQIKHPDYQSKYISWMKWRAVYESGDYFLYTYLIKTSIRESVRDFEERRRVSYVPAFATGAVNQVRNSLYQRMIDISREGGSSTYQSSVKGLDFGVDNLGSDMNAFIGMKVLPELLVMSRVGIYVDMPPVGYQDTLEDVKGKKPYCYVYQAEDICSYSYDDSARPNEFLCVLLCDRTYGFDSQYGLPYGTIVSYRLLTLIEGIDGERKVEVRIFNDQGLEDDDRYVLLDIDRIPFIMLEISHSLLSDIANYQIAALNLASSDLSYCLSANYPFYTEQYDPITDNYIKEPGHNTEFVEYDQWNMEASTDNITEIRTGPTQGRRYPKGTNQPQFIHPSPEPMKASMEKQARLKEEIKEIVGLTLSNIRPKMASAESKSLDLTGEEAGLSYIGLVLQYSERKIAEYWAMYENTKPALINYPERYSLISDDERRNEVDYLLKVLPTTPSNAMRKRIYKRIAYLLIGQYTRAGELDSIYREIENAEIILPDKDLIIDIILNGVIDLKSVAKAFGFPEEVVTKAADEHTARLDRIQKAQSPDPNMQARGVKDLGGDPNASKTEKALAKETAKEPVPEDPTRGAGQ